MRFDRHGLIGLKFSMSNYFKMGTSLTYTDITHELTLTLLMHYLFLVIINDLEKSLILISKCIKGKQINSESFFFPANLNKFCQMVKIYLLLFHKNTAQEPFKIHTFFGT